GAVIELERVPRVARSLPPEVLLCSETQERYCWVVPPSFAAELEDLYNREFGLGGVHPGAAAAVIGHATGELDYLATWQGEAVVECPVDAITAGRRVRRPSRRRPPPGSYKPRRQDPDPREALLHLLKGFGLGSREYLTRHYDSEVQGRTWLRPGEADAVVVRPDPAASLC